MVSKADKVDDKLISVVIKVDKLTHRELKIFAAKRGLTLSDAGTYIINSRLMREGKQ